MTYTYVRALSGAVIDFANPDPGQIRLSDIIFNLSNITRFQGGMYLPWSVASHSLMVAGLAHQDGQPMEVQRWALMHDFHEAYTGDIPSPLKRYVEGDVDGLGGQTILSDLEEKLDEVICVALGVPRPGPVVRAIVDRFDKEAYQMEVEMFRSPVDTSLLVSWQAGASPACIMDMYANRVPLMWADAKRHNLNQAHGAGNV